MNSLYMSIIMNIPNMNSIGNWDSYMGKARGLGIKDECGTGTGQSEWVVVQALERGSGGPP